MTSGHFRQRCLPKTQPKQQKRPNASATRRKRGSNTRAHRLWLWQPWNLEVAPRVELLPVGATNQPATRSWMRWWRYTSRATQRSLSVGWSKYSVALGG
jgi:hypothetical protein